MKKVLFIFTMMSCSLWAQTNSYYGFFGGVCFDLGTHVNRVGLSVGMYYTYEFAQANVVAKVYYNFQSLGLKKKTPEIQLGGGLNLGFGPRDTTQNVFNGLTENNMRYRHAAGYSYIRYWDKNQTSQSTGLFNVEIGPVKVVTENDLFAGGKGWRDRFRTGALQLNYTDQNVRGGISMIFWTGDFVGCEIVQDSIYPTRFGYRLAEKSHYGLVSLSSVSVQADYLYTGLPFAQNLRFNTGVNAEQVRHVVQNKFIHDQPFLPDKMTNDAPHIPMISSTGDQYLFKPGQRIKPASLYFRASLNSTVFY